MIYAPRYGQCSALTSEECTKSTSSLNLAFRASGKSLSMHVKDKSVPAQRAVVKSCKAVTASQSSRNDSERSSAYSTCKRNKGLQLSSVSSTRRGSQNSDTCKASKAADGKVQSRKSRIESVQGFCWSPYLAKGYLDDSNLAMDDLISIVTLLGRLPAGGYPSPWLSNPNSSHTESVLLKRCSNGHILPTNYSNFKKRYDP